MALAVLEPLFRSCDGYLDGERLRELSAQMGIADDAIDAILEDLDQDRDGKISLQDFVRGFSDFLLTSSPSLEKEKVPEDDVTTKDGWELWDSILDDEAQKEREDQLIELCDATEVTEEQRVTCFEGMIERLVGNVRQLHEENQQLQLSWKREKVQHERHLQTLEEELTNQMKETETKVKRKAAEEVEEERKLFRERMSLEAERLQRHVALVEKMQTWLKLHHHHEDHEKLSAAREKLERAFHENRSLRLALLDTQTNVALMHAELTQLKALYAEKCHELQKERENVLEVLHEHEILTQQLNKICFVNRKLQDTNDTLSGRRHTSFALPTIYRKRGSVVGDYVMDNGMHRVTSEEYFHLNLTKNDDDDNDDFKHPRSSSSLEGDDRDSGMFTFRDVDDDNDEDDASVPESVATRLSDVSKREEKLQETKSERKVSVAEERKEETSNSEEQTKISHVDDVIDEEKEFSSPTDGLHQSRETKSKKPRRGCSDPLPSVECLLASPPGGGRGPDRTYKVVFAGDAAVGKSSFILFICRGVFVQHLNSTLGIDFCMKTMKVDKENVTVQLWDTAGQERFRSITQSYFRKVDGVMLLYDCTSERSFLNVRQWIEAIKESTSRKIPIALIGNKSDQKGSASRVITRSEGERLAKAVDALFFEASAKNGTNVLESVTQLIRLMAVNEDHEINSSGLCLQNSAKKNSRCCNK